MINNNNQCYYEESNYYNRQSSTYFNEHEFLYLGIHCIYQDAITTILLRLLYYITVTD